MRIAIACLLIALLAPEIPASGTPALPSPPLPPLDGRPHYLRTRWNEIFWCDDMESGENMWTHGDLGADVEPHWHLDTFLACPDSTAPQWSWWCGTLDYDDESCLPGGYGNNWTDFLELPPVELGSTAVEHASWGAIKARYRDDVERDREPGERRRDSGQPVLSFSYRYDTEPYYDFVWVQAESLGSWVNLNNGWCGSSGGWRDFGEFGFPLSSYGDPVRVRFCFSSDRTASDEDGRFDSDGGACHVDNIRIFDAVTGEILFLEDCEDPAACQCSPGDPPEPAGDLWHIQNRPCKASSGTHIWWCGDDADTAHLPPGLNNYLLSPIVDIAGAWSCTVNAIITMACPTPSTMWRELVTLDRGASFYEVGCWYGDQFNWGYGPCDLFYAFGRAGQSCVPALQPSAASCGLMYVMFSDRSAGIHGPGGNGDIGITIDDAVMYGQGLP